MANYLILVHPGSLCGSYHSSAYDSKQYHGLLKQVANFTGTKITIDGDFLDEIDDYPELAEVYYEIDETFEAGPSGDELGAAVHHIIAKFSLSKDDTVLVTGAWADADTGCVTTVAAELREHCEANIEISKFAPSLD